MIVELSVEDATPERLAPFGELVGAALGVGRATRFYDDAVELYPAPPFESDADTCLAVARIRRRPYAVTYMERHFKHTQVFLPLNRESYVVVVAPPERGDVPDLGLARAFRFRGDQGFLMNVGTWHEFPFAMERPVDMVVVLRNETNRNLDQVENGEAVGDDLEKRHIQQRFGRTLGFRL